MRNLIKALSFVCFILLSVFFSSKIIAWQESDLPVFTMKLGLEVGGDFRNGRFSDVDVVEVGSDGKVYVSTYKNENEGQIQIFTPSGEYLSQINPGDESEWQFFAIGDIALDSEDNLYLLDQYGHKIVKLDSSGEFVSEFSTVRSGDSSYAYYYHIAVDNAGYIYVSDRVNRSVRKFSSSGEYIAGYQLPLLQDPSPESIAIGPNGHVYVVVAGGGERKIVELNPDMTLAETIITFVDSEDGVAITDIEFDSGGNILLVDTNHNSIMKLGSSGDYISEFGETGAGHGLFISAFNIGLDPRNDDLYVGDCRPGAVEKFNPAGEYLLTVGLDLSVDGLFNTPSDVSVGEDGSIYVADTYNYRVQKFSDVGVYQDKFGHYRSDILDEDGFIMPSAIEVDINGDFYVSDLDQFGNSSAVKKFDSDGNYLFSIESEGPGKIDSDSSGNIYFSAQDGSIKKYAQDGEFIADLGVDIGLDSLFGISLDGEENMYFYGLDEEEKKKIVETTSDGEVLRSFLVPGNGYYITDVAIEDDGDFYVTVTVQDEETEIETSNLSKYDSSGNLLFTQTADEGFWGVISGIDLDNSGNLFVVDSTSGRVLKFTQDKIPPAVNLEAPSSVSKGTAVTISGTAVDELTDIDSVQYQVDSQSGSWLSYEGDLPKEKTVDFAFKVDNLSVGSHVVYVKATDSKTNETIKGVSIKVLQVSGSGSNLSTSETTDSSTPVDISLRITQSTGRISFSWDAMDVVESVCTFEVQDLSGNIVVASKEVPCIEAKVLEDGDIEALKDGSTYVAIIKILGADGSVLGQDSEEFVYHNEDIVTVPEKTEEGDKSSEYTQNSLPWIIGSFIVAIFLVFVFFIFRQKR